MDPDMNSLTEEKLAKFMTKNNEFNEESDLVSDYLIVDNFVDFFAEYSDIQCL